MESAFYNHLSSNEMKTFLVFVKKGYKGDAEKNILSLSAGQVIRVLDRCALKQKTTTKFPF